MSPPLDSAPANAAPSRSTPPPSVHIGEKFSALCPGTLTFFSFGARSTRVREACPVALLKPQKLHTTALLGSGAEQLGQGSGESASSVERSDSSTGGAATAADVFTAGGLAGGAAP